MPALVGSVAVALVMMVVIVPSASLWAAGGGVLGDLLSTERTRRAVSAVLALLLVATIAYVWV